MSFTCILSYYKTPDLLHAVQQVDPTIKSRQDAIHFLNTHLAQMPPTHCNILNYGTPIDYTNRIFLGGELAANNTEWLIDEGITDIFNMTSHINYIIPHSIMVHQYPMEDTIDQSILPAIAAADDIYELLETDPNAKILLHCRMGQSRSATTAIITLLLFNPDMSIQEAWDSINKHKPVGCELHIANLNLGFQMQLQQFQKSLLDTPEIVNDTPFTFDKPRTRRPRST